MDSNSTSPSTSAGSTRVSPRLLLAAGGLMAANCLVWGAFLLACGGCVLSNVVTQPALPPATGVVQATAVPTRMRTPLPRPSPSPASEAPPTSTAAPTTWIANPTASWATLAVPSATPVRPTHTPTPWPIQVIQGVDAEAKVQALLDLAAKGPDIPFRVVFTEREIEDEIEHYLAQQPEAPYRNVAVTLQPTGAVVDGQVKVSGLWIDVTIHADVTAQGGRPVLTVTQVDLGPIPLPGSVKDDINQEIRGMLAAAERLPFRFTAITLGTGRVTIQGMTR